MIKPILEQEFKPAVIELRKFREIVNVAKEKETIIIAIERNDGYIYRREIECLKEGINDEINTFIVERIIKSILWSIGGFRIYLSGSKKVYENIKDYYRIGGLREFDYNFMSTVFERKMEVIYLEKDKMPKEVDCFIPLDGNLQGKKIGLDLGGSDIKISAINNGEILLSEEIIWNPKTHEDISYHYECIYNALKMGIDKLGGDVDGIGISTAGVIVRDRPMVSSLYIKVPKSDFELVKGIYTNTIKRLEDELGHKIAYVVANDGDVTALAGANDLKDNCVLGLAMGTSEAGGYINKNGGLNGWFSELAFMPVDYNKDSAIDDWSGDFGVGAQYFSQDAVIKLARRAGIILEDSLTPAEKLSKVQDLLEKGHEGARKIFESIGVYLAYGIAYYAEIYEIKHVIILGRVTSKEGGNIILQTAKETLKKEFPEYANITIGLPSEKMRRLGQSITAASLPKINN